MFIQYLGHNISQYKLIEEREFDYTIKFFSYYGVSRNLSEKDVFFLKAISRIVAFRF